MAGKSRVVVGQDIGQRIAELTNATFLVAWVLPAFTELEHNGLTSSHHPLDADEWSEPCLGSLEVGKPDVGLFAKHGL